MQQGPIRVVIIDDDEFAYRVVKTDLAEVHTTRFEVAWRSNYQAGLEALMGLEFDVALLDFQLGEHSGLDLLKAATAAGSRLPVVLLTAHVGDGLDLEAMRAGASDYLVKGEFGPKLLERCLRYAVERGRAVEALRESRERYELAVAGADDGLWDWKLATDEIYFSPRWKQMLGYDDPEFENRPESWFDRAHPEDLSRLKADLDQHLQGRTTQFECTHRLMHKDGTFRWVTSRGIAVRSKRGLATRLAGSQRDVTRSVGHDSLTGLPNRLLFLDRVSHVMERSRRHRRFDFAVLFLDLDRFKWVNDSLGHGPGDLMLIEFARRLKRVVRGADTVARLGGDEFAVLLEEVGEPAAAGRAAVRIQETLASPFEIGGREIFASVSLGIALGGPTYDRPEEMLRDADTAMYRAKAGGRARHEVFDQQMHAEAVSRLQIESELRRSVEAGAFRAVFQPIIDLDSGNIVEVEALVRWPHPTRGLVPPDQFIPLAEETGLIHGIDRWVLRRGCEQVRKWQQQFEPRAPLVLSVNLSKKQFGRGGLVDEVEKVLSETGLPPHTLSLELTESVILEDPAGVRKILWRLRDRGVGLSMDDFGTGYSSLSYLQQLPFTTIKIDRSFVAKLEGRAEGMEIVRAIIVLARAVKARVIAEGVETAEQLAALRELGCDCAQGYFFSKPLEPTALEALLVQGRAWPAVAV